MKSEVRSPRLRPNHFWLGGFEPHSLYTRTNFFASSHSSRSAKAKRKKNGFGVAGCSGQLSYRQLPIWLDLNQRPTGEITKTYASHGFSRLTKRNRWIRSGMGSFSR
jgi:hypothetical protein